MPIKRFSRADFDPAKVDWSRIDATTEEDIKRHIAEDPDAAPEMESPEGWAIVRNVPVPDIRAIRAKLGVSQAKFAALYGFSARTVQQWEQKRSMPEPHTRIFLKVIETHPDAVRRVAMTMTKRTIAEDAQNGGAKTKRVQKLAAKKAATKPGKKAFRSAAPAKGSVGTARKPTSLRSARPPRARG